MSSSYFELHYTLRDAMAKTRRLSLYNVYKIMTVKNLIEQGRKIKSSLKDLPSGEGVTRVFAAYYPANIDEYYRWKECSIRFLQLYSPSDVERFVKYSNEFENHHFYARYISNMIGVLEACELLPSERMTLLNKTEEREDEMAKVQELQKLYESHAKGGDVYTSADAFHNWHAAACVLFDKWFYPTEEDWFKFQSIEGVGNGYVLKHEYDGIYSSYKKLMARIKEGRGLKGVVVPNKITSYQSKSGSADKINIFISYAHADEKWLERLKKHLKVLTKYSDSIEYWEDTKLRGGDRWREEITKAINKANVAILLVSTNFLASDFIESDELPPILRKAQEDGTRILPLIVAPCSFEFSEISEFQAINSPDRTLADLGADEAAIERVYLELIKNIQSLL